MVADTVLKAWFIIVKFFYNSRMRGVWGETHNSRNC